MGVIRSPCFTSRRQPSQCHVTLDQIRLIKKACRKEVLAEFLAARARPDHRCPQTLNIQLMQMPAPPGPASSYNTDLPKFAGQSRSFIRSIFGVPQNRPEFVSGTHVKHAITMTTSNGPMGSSNGFVMHQRIQQLAELSVGRACGFAALGIITFMVGMSGKAQLALISGGILVLITCLSLTILAYWAPNRPYKRTEVWMMLEEWERPQPPLAQRLIGSILRDVYYRFALRAAWCSAGLLIAALLIGLVTNPQAR